MEEELSYASVVFKNGAAPPKEKKEEETVYAEVKSKKPATVPADGEAAAHTHLFHMLVGCFVALCVLLVAGITAIIYFHIKVSEQREKFSELTAQNEQLTSQLNFSETKREQVRRQRDHLERTMGFILNFENFPVNEFCPNKECKPCRDGWIHFQDKCYLFYDLSHPRLTWNESLQYCKDNVSDLVIVENLLEQKFIKNNTKYYHDQFHGYWIGLRQSAEKNWLWVDGSNDTLNYWITETLGESGPCALVIPDRNATASWDEASCKMKNKFICEGKTLITSF